MAVESVPGPLSGVTVISLEQAVSAPMCTRVLADFGARVIKVEKPRGGDFAREYDQVVQGLAAHFVWADRGKESVALNIEDPDGSAALHRLLDSADVFVSDLAPGAVTALGFGPDELAARHPGLISISIDGYGAGGTLSHKRAYDLLIQAESGACAVTGTPGSPAKPGPPIADVSTGIYAALSIVTMLYARNAPGRPVPGPTSGSVSLFDTMAELMGYALTWSRHTGIDQEPIGMRSPAVAPYGAYPTRDGQIVVLGTTNDREWQRLAGDLLARPDLAGDHRFATNAGRVGHRAELDAAIAQWCAGRDLDVIQRQADAAGIGNARYNTPTEVLAHPHLTQRKRWRAVATPAGPVTALLPPPILTGYDPPMGAVPALGQHTDAVLTEAGFDTDALAALRDRGAIGPAVPAGAVVERTIP
ncbi:CaiB/BaiF CoA transferase family protein [Nocardia rhamnosiphila]|uniref:CaiB/BaiF CoA transferase family protein n=1 Tax=Nocardia rhamnosiphila TaxID=426716 RepID=UPI0004C3AE6C|nr:CaiB/BaiF CoA-transferase family protein [Nocardia rhamnosiphila]